MTVLVLTYRLRDIGIVEVFPEIRGRNIELIDHDNKQPQFCALRNPRQDHTPFWEAVMEKLNSLFARGEESGDPGDDRVRDVICAQLPDQYLMVDEVKSS